MQVTAPSHTYSPAQLPVMTAHGVGLSWPSDPLDSRSLRDCKGAAKVRVASITPREGQSRSNTMYSAEGAIVRGSTT